MVQGFQGRTGMVNQNKIFFSTLKSCLMFVPYFQVLGITQRNRIPTPRFISCKVWRCKWGSELVPALLIAKEASIRLGPPRELSLQVLAPPWAPQFPNYLFAGYKNLPMHLINERETEAQSDGIIHLGTGSGRSSLQPCCSLPELYRELPCSHKVKTLHSSDFSPMERWDSVTKYHPHPERQTEAKRYKTAAWWDQTPTTLIHHPRDTPAPKAPSVLVNYPTGGQVGIAWPQLGV